MAGLLCSMLVSDFDSGLVDLILDLVASRWPNAVYTDGIKFFLTTSVVNPSMTMFPFRIFLMNEDLVGYPNAACQKETNCCILFTSTAGDADFWFG